MSSTGIIDDLVREEELRIIVCQCFGLVWLWYPLEEEDEAVNRSKVEKSLVNSLSLRDYKFGTYWILFSSSSSRVISSSTCVPRTPIS